MALFFEWDPAKARKNLEKHQIPFEEATTVFGDPRSITIADPLHSAHENRFIVIGLSHRLHVLVVVFTERGERIRIISSRSASRRERRMYEKR